MQTLKLILVSLFLTLGLAACSGSKNGSDPNVYTNPDLKDLPRSDYAKGGVNFSMAKVEGLKSVSRDSVGWASYMQESDANGQIVYYFLKGEEIDLSSAQVRVEYIHKDLPNCSETDSLFGWLKSVFLTDDRQGKVNIKDQYVETMDGQKVEIMGIITPEMQVNDSVRHSEKSMAWAYIEQGQRWVGLSLSAVEKGKFDKALPLMKDLIASYKAN